jgi:hypothetical protein
MKKCILYILLLPLTVPFSVLPFDFKLHIPSFKSCILVGVKLVRNYGLHAAVGALSGGVLYLLKDNRRLWDKNRRLEEQCVRNIHMSAGIVNFGLDLDHFALRLCALEQAMKIKPELKLGSVILEQNIPRKTIIQRNMTGLLTGALSSRYFTAQ